MFLLARFDAAFLLASALSTPHAAAAVFGGDSPGGDSEFNGLYIVVALKKLCKSAVHKNAISDSCFKAPLQLRHNTDLAHLIMRAMRNKTPCLFVGLPLPFVNTLFLNQNSEYKTVKKQLSSSKLRPKN
jgi:hypothetical protein